MDSQNVPDLTEELRNLLIPTHLHYDIGSKPLRARALAEIFTKTLYLSSDRKMTLSELASESAKIIGIKQIPKEDLSLGVNFLTDNKAIFKQKDFLVLSEDAAIKVKKGIDDSRERIDLILKENFSLRIDRDILAKWFRRAAADFFGEYGNIWVKSIFRKQIIDIPDKDFLEKTISRSIIEYGLVGLSDDLITGFKAFLTNYNDPNNNLQIWSFAQAMLSARIVAAAVGPDPITVNEFKNAKLFLDTNAFFLAVLEKSKASKTFSELAKCLKDIDATLCFVRSTKNEYERVVAGRKRETLAAVENFSLDILKESSDPFLKTAIARGCNDRESFERFFDSIEKIPDKIDGLVKINLEEYPDTVQAIEAGSKDMRVQAQIKAEWEKYHRYTRRWKSENAIEHDAELNSVAEMLRKNKEKVWIITMDRSMQSLSLRWAVKGLPIWIPLDALVQILSIWGAGPAHKPENFAPLLSAIIETEIQPGYKTFAPEDLTELLALEERINEFNRDQIKDFAIDMARLRLSGKSKDSGELQLKIRRTFEQKKLNHNEESQALRNRISALEKDKEDQAKEAIEALAKEIRPRLIRWIYIKNIGLSLIPLAIGLLLLKYGIDNLAIDKNLGMTFVIVAIFEIILPLIYWIIPAIKKELKNTDEQAKKEAEKSLKKS